MLRKSLLIILLGLLILVGCKNKQNPNINIVNGSEIKIVVGDTYQLICELNDINGKATWEASNDNVKVSNNGLVEGLKIGETSVTVKIGDISSTININIVTELADMENDPYENVSKDDFYASYTKASSYLDAYYRTQHNLLSGDNVVPDQAPTISSYQPKDGDTYLRNTSAYYADSGNTYYIIDSYGNVVNAIYRGAAYITIEEVAAYVLAFGDVPVNYEVSKSFSPQASEWGEYLRVNHTYFSGDTERYPYEPLLPDISGEGGSLDYYEIDLGTTGTDCDPTYVAKIYNDGKTIVRGAARIVYTRYDADGNNIVDINEKYVFYTYNHYNDFQEYLNYQGGWGEMFGNICGGGELSSRENYNPTPYVNVKMVDFSTLYN